MDAVLIINPHAGSGDQAESVIRLARHAGVDVWQTQEEGDVRRFAARGVRDGVGRVILAGGDGSISEAVNGLMSTGTPRDTSLGVVPMGTANDFCRSVDLSCDPIEALEVAMHGHEHDFDVIRVHHPEGEYYLINAATGGFSRVAASKLNKDVKQLWGALAYLRAAVGTLADVPEYDITLVVDGERIEARTPAVIIANGRYAGGGVELAPEAEPDDRLMDVVVAHAEGFVEWVKLGGSYLAGTHLHDANVIFRRAARVELTSEPAMKFSSDGEPVGETPMTFEIVPRAVRLLVRNGYPAGAASCE